MHLLRVYTSGSRLLNSSIPKELFRVHGQRRVPSRRNPFSLICRWGEILQAPSFCFTMDGNHPVSYCLRGCEASYPQLAFQAIFPELIGTTSQTIRSIRAPVVSLSRLSKQLTSSAARWSLVRIHRDLEWLSGLCLAYVWSDWLLSAQ